MVIGVTGANGYVGKALCVELLNKGFKVRAFLRASSKLNLPSSDSLEYFFIDNFLNNTAWRSGLKDLNVLIHCAAKTSHGNLAGIREQQEFQTVNFHATEVIAREASACGVKHFIFLSSIKVHGERNHHNQPFRETDTPQPSSLYAKTKLEAEKYLFRLCKHNNMKLSIIRSPAVYGPNIQGNIGRLLRVCNTAIPLPLANFHSKRSFIFIDNLVSFILTCALHPSPTKIWLVSDNMDISTTEFVSKIRDGYERPLRLFIVPDQIWRITNHLTKSTRQIMQLNYPLQMDITPSIDKLNWTPGTTIDTGIKKMLSAHR